MESTTASSDETAGVAAAVAAAPAASGDTGASRTFQSLFGAGGDAAGSAVRIAARERRPGQDKESDEDGDVWDDDFPSDANIESAEEDNGGVGKTLAAESRQSMSDWADNDDDEDNWKDALQARVDQLELVVEKTVDPAVLLIPTLPTNTAVMPPAAKAAATYAPPVDQRATLTLVPKTNLLRSISAPPAADEHKPPSKLKRPNVGRSTTTSATSSTNARAKQASAESATASSEQEVPARKRSNSRDFSTRGVFVTDAKRLTKATSSSAPTAASNSVFVRAVVARGNSAGGRSADTRITKDGHVDKRPKADDRAAVLALSDAEAVRRHILNDVKKISIERIIADAKRLQFLEDLHRHQSSSASAADRQRSSCNTNTAAAAAAAETARASPTKKQRA